MKIKIRQGKYKDTFEMELNKDKWVIVDNLMKYLVVDHKWSFGSKRYAVRKENGKSVLMHRILSNCPKDKEIDHINNNGLDNRLVNLRICTRRENSLNRSPIRNNKYRGIWFKKDGSRKKRWFSGIKINGKVKVLGYFLTDKEAAITYNKYAKKYFGEYARLNII